MPAKKKTTRSQRKVKTVAASKRAVKKASKKKPAIKSKSTKSTTKKRSPQKAAEATTSGKRKKTATKETARNIQEQLQDKSRAVYAVASRSRREEFSGRQSGDLQGLSRAEQADSESVDELLEEGNPFEADAVAGVEDADSADEREVHTREVPEDDVPEEYFEKE